MKISTFALIKRQAAVGRSHVEETELVSRSSSLSNPFFHDHLLNIQLTLAVPPPGLEWPERANRFAPFIRSRFILQSRLWWILRRVTHCVCLSSCRMHYSRESVYWLYSSASVCLPLALRLLLTDQTCGPTTLWSCFKTGVYSTSSMWWVKNRPLKRFVENLSFDNPVCLESIFGRISQYYIAKCCLDLLFT